MKFSEIRNNKKLFIATIVLLFYIVAYTIYFKYPYAVSPQAIFANGIVIAIIVWKIESDRTRKKTYKDKPWQPLPGGWPSKFDIEKSLNYDKFRNGNFWFHIGSSYYWNDLGHILTVGGTRAGKGGNFVLPPLLDPQNSAPHAPSFVVLDPKGENAAVSFNHLSNSGYGPIILSPFVIPEIEHLGSSWFNPFTVFSADDPDFDEFTDMIVNAILPPNPKEHSYFGPASRTYLSLYIRHMMTQDKDPKNIETIYKWIRFSGDNREDLLGEMIFNESFDGDIKADALAIYNQLKTSSKPDEIESVYSSLRIATDIFKDKYLRESMSETDFDIKQIANEKMAIYVCLSPANLKRCQVWVRIVFGTIMRVLATHYNISRKVILLMDEFVTMGTLHEFEIASGFLAGYNVTLWPIINDLSQLKRLYPDSWETFVNNAFIKHYIDIGDNFTAEYIQKRLPKVNRGTEEKQRWDYALDVNQILNKKDSYFMEIKSLYAIPSVVAYPYWVNDDLKHSASPNPFLNLNQ